jgi:segregation and condensation protein A
MTPDRATPEHIVEHSVPHETAYLPNGTNGHAHGNGNGHGSGNGTANGAFQVRLEVFEGPLDLLLKLIERKQLDISKVALAEVTDAFLQYLARHPDMPPAPLASFVWVASKLILIKSQVLLPRPPIQRTDEDEEDPGDELIRRLEAYKRVQEAAKWLRGRDQAGLRSYERPAPLEPPTKAKPEPAELGTGLEGVTLAKLVKLVQRRMQLQMPVGPPRGTVTRGHTVTVAEKVTQLRSRLSRLGDEGKIALSEDFVESAMRSRTDLVVLFLAVLEIVRRGYGLAEQDELFGEIWLRRREE